MELYSVGNLKATKCFVVALPFAWLMQILEMVMRWKVKKWTTLQRLPQLQYPHFSKAMKCSRVASGYDSITQGLGTPG